MFILRYVDVAKAGDFCCKKKYIERSAILLKAKCRFTGFGLFDCWVGDEGTGTFLQIACGEGALVGAVEYLTFSGNVERLPAELGPLYDRPGKPGRPIIDLDTWNAPDGQQDDFMCYDVAVVPYLVGNSLLLCLGERPEVRLFWIHLSHGAHMGFDDLGRLKAVRFADLCARDVSFLEKVDYSPTDSSTKRNSSCDC